MASRSFKQAIVAGAAALVVGGAALGIVSAQQPAAAPAAPAVAVGRQAPAASGLTFQQAAPAAAATPTTPNQPNDPQEQQEQQQQQNFLDAVAAKLGITTQKLQDAINQVRQEQGLPAGGLEGGRHGGKHGMRMGLDAAATAINITPDQLRQELNGKSLTDVAKAHNVDPQKVADALKADAIKGIDQAVTDGKLTSDQATQMKANLDAKISEMMTRTFQAEGPEGADDGPGRGQPGSPTTPGGTTTPGGSSGPQAGQGSI